MKGKRKLFGILLVIAALIIMQLPGSEADAATSASDFKMEGTTLVKYLGTDKTVSVPASVEVIGQDAFDENDSIEKVILPDSVTKIEAYAFWGCDSLNTVVLGEGLLEVGDFVFANCKGLKEMNLPENIRSIGIQAFVDCVNLTDITIPPEVTDIHESAFDGCYRLVIHCEAGSTADKYAKAFYQKQLEMPEYEDVSDYEPADTEDDRDTDDGKDAPARENEAAGELLGSTKVVANQAVLFIDNTSPRVQSGMPGSGSKADSDPESVQTAQDMNGLGQPGADFPKYAIVDGSIVADQAYYRSREVTSLALPDGIKEIGQFAFARSTLTDIVIPEGAEKIGYGAFYHCDDLTGVALPDTLISIEPKAFAYTAWVENFLAGADNGENKDFLISGSALIAYRGDASHVEIPDGVKVIAAEVFKGHREIESVEFPESLAVIGEGAFEDCSTLKELSAASGKEISFLKGLTDIKDRAFAGCALMSVKLPPSVERIGLQAFDKTVEAAYTGKTPAASHETSAERLSNEEYRAPGPETAGAGVTVEGMENTVAQLEGAGRRYTLTISPVSDAAVASDVTRAFERAGRGAAPDDMLLYDLTLYDNSGIPISKLGRQKLTVTMPLSGNFAGEGVKVVTLDRNGQLELVESTRVEIEGMDYIRFRTGHLSAFGIFGDGNPLEKGDILQEISVSTSQNAAPLQDGFWTGSLKRSLGGHSYRFILGGGLLFIGMICIFKKGKNIR